MPTTTTPMSDQLEAQRKLLTAKANLYSIAGLCLFAGTVAAIVWAFTR